jgi:predicted aspartyl protease
MFVNVLINGRPVEVIFDTGASTCLFGKQQLNNAGVTYVPTGSTQVRGIGADTLNCDQANLRVSLGEITKTIYTAIVPGKMNTASLLGQDFFNEFRYDIDTATGVIHLRKKGVRSVEALDTINIPFKVAGREMLVDARVNGRQCVMIFDTGSFNNIFTAATWSQLGLSIPADARMVSTGGVGGSSKGFLFRADKIELGGVMKVNPEVVVLESGPPYPLLGQEFLKDKRFSIDNDNQVIRFVH